MSYWVDGYWCDDASVSTVGESVHYRCLLAIQDRIKDVGLDGIDDDSIVVLKAPVALGKFTGPNPALDMPGIIICPWGTETIAPNAGTNARDDYDYPCLVAILDASNRKADGDWLTDDLPDQLLWRSTIARSFSNGRLSTDVGEVLKTYIQPGAIVDLNALLNSNLFHSALVVRCVARETRI